MKRSLSIVLVLLAFAAGAVSGRVTARKESPIPSQKEKLRPRIIAGVVDVRQSTGYSCGAAALQAILAFWGTSEREDRLMARLRTSPEQGTSPENIVRVAREYGLQADLRENLNLEDLEAALGQGCTPIVDLQAWRDGAAQAWAETWEDGHYMVLLGMDADRLYFEDPSLLGSRGFIPRREFVERWHDYEGDPPLDASDRAYSHMAIFIRGAQRASWPEFTAVE
jgi:hypothetical protein